MPSPSLPKKIGLVAGWGSFPVEVAQRLRKDGHEVFVVGLKGHANPELEAIASRFLWKGVLKIGAHLRYLKSQRVEAVVLAGKIFKDKILYQGLGWIEHLPDLTCYRVLGGSFVTRRRDGRDDTILAAIVSEYERQGMRVLPIHEFATDLLVKTGTLTNRAPNRNEDKDAQFGWGIAKQMGAFDIGQSITVKDQIVLGVEAIEGTDALIERTAALCPRGGFTLVKVAKPNQDMRFDVPTIGMRTVQRMADSGGSTIVVEAGRTILVDRNETLALANRLGVKITALEEPAASNDMDHLETLSIMTPVVGRVA